MPHSQEDFSMSSEQLQQVLKENNRKWEESVKEPPKKAMDTKKKYVGSKIILAEPMTQEAFLKFKGRYRDGQETYGDGYLVEYEDKYQSWSPKDVFERCYREISKSEIEMMYR